MIDDSLTNRIRQFFHSRPCRTFGLLLMMTACLFFAGRQTITGKAADPTSESTEGFTDGSGLKDSFSSDDMEKLVEGTEDQDEEDADGDEQDRDDADGGEQIEGDSDPEDWGEEDQDDGDPEAEDSFEEDNEDDEEEEKAASVSKAGTPVRIVLSGQKRFKAGDYYFYANANFDTLLYSSTADGEGSELLKGENFKSIFVTDGRDLYYFTSGGLERYSIDKRSAELIMPLDAGQVVTPYILQVYGGKYYYTLYKNDTNSVFYCYDIQEKKVSAIAEDRLAPDLYSGAEGQYMILMSTDFSKTYLYDCTSGQTHEVGQGTVCTSFWQGNLYVSQIENQSVGSAHLKVCSLPDLQVVKAITIGENIITNSFADGYFYYSYGKQDENGSIQEEHFVRVDPMTGEQKAISREECDLALYNRKNP